jgi:hypothetical protein
MIIEEYKGFKIEEETEPWALKNLGPIKITNDDYVRNRETIEEARELIDELASDN